MSAPADVLDAARSGDPAAFEQLVGLYRADSEAELDGLLAALPLSPWMRTTVTPLAPHPNDPASPRPSGFEFPIHA